MVAEAVRADSAEIALPVEVTRELKVLKEPTSAGATLMVMTGSEQASAPVIRLEYLGFSIYV